MSSESRVDEVSLGVPRSAPMKRFVSTKTFTHAQGLSCAFRQHRAESHCRFLHGYSLEVRIEFEATRLDERGWVVDFGGMKEIRTWIEGMFDHKTIIASDDPALPLFQKLQDAGVADVTVLQCVGCESFASVIYDQVSIWLGKNEAGRVRVRSVEVREHAGNSAIVERA